MESHLCTVCECIQTLSAFSADIIRFVIYQCTAFNGGVIRGTSAVTIFRGAGIGHQTPRPVRGSPPQSILQ